MSFSPEEIEEFKVESQELLDLSEKSLLSLDQGSDYRTCFDAIFRGFHNIKGSAGMMEFDDLQAHTHELETILMTFKDKGSIPQNYINLFLRGIDAARSILEGQNIQFDYSVQSETGESETQYEFCDSTMNEFLAECEEIIERISKHLQSVESGNANKEIIDQLYREIHSLKGSSYLFSFRKLGDVAHAMESSLELVRDGSHGASKNLVDCLFKSLKVLDGLTKKIRNKEPDDSFDKVIPLITRALTAATQNLPPIGQEEHPSLVVPKASVQTNNKDKEGEALSSIRVPVVLLDSLMTLMGEMVLVRNQVLQYSNHKEDLELSSMSKRLNVVTSEIQEEMMKTRMQPIGNILEKFNRVVRDLSQDLHKKIHLVIQGADTELDKSLLEAVKDPLTHIVRNSCDHGIELPEVRKQFGKPEAGTITIKSYHEGGQVVIEISDDGKGLSKDVIVKKAIEKGIISPNIEGHLSDKEAYELIFAPGFSTASQITNVSGRGVGMDVVRTNIEKIGGSVELSGKQGSGASIKIKIPLTLAIVPALIVKCKDGTFAIPQVKIEELVRVDPDSEHKIEMLHNSPVYRLRGDILPLVDLNKILDIQEENHSYSNRVINIVILNAENFSFGVIVDEIQDTLDIVVKPLSRLLKSLQVYAGATILGDGSISLIFDVMGISKVAQLAQKKVKNKEDDKNFKINENQELLLVKLNSSTKHALALNYVQRLEEFKAQDIEYSGDQRVIRYRGDILPLVSTNEQLGYSLDKEAKETLSVVVIERSGKLYGIEVNDILDTFSTPLEIKEPIKKHHGIFGNLNTNDELIVIIDPFELITGAFSTAIEEFTIMDNDRQGTILLVEDTVYFRKAIKSILEKRGFQVLVAQDGLEALEILNRNETQIDLIVSDIEMPRMNGFQMAKEIRRHPRYSKLPLLAVSSRSDKTYRQAGMNAGFDMYLEKLKPEVLLAAISELWQGVKRVA